jgi:hypothetical protein
MAKQPKSLISADDVALGATLLTQLAALRHRKAQFIAYVGGAAVVFLLRDGWRRQHGNCRTDGSPSGCEFESVLHHGRFCSKRGLWADVNIGNLPMLPVCILI